MALRVGPALLLMILGIVMIWIVATLTSLWVPVDPDSAILLVFENLILYIIVLGICVYTVGIEELFRCHGRCAPPTRPPRRRETASDQLAYTVTSLGYATAVSVLIFDPFSLLKAGAQHAHGGGDVPFSRSVILVVVHLVVVVLAMPVHALAGHLAGLNAARRLPFSRAGLEAFALRSALAVLGTTVTLTHSVYINTTRRLPFKRVGLQAFALRSALVVLGILWVKRLPFRSALMAWALTYIATVALMMWCIKLTEGAAATGSRTLKFH
ncbi:hypothetical protein JKP88DRAFT_300763 [Tribonema minus]|uniref:Uncharacterized protein n=1 Tax=Tribonema minus TaxID=303371 RepID=A0A835ZCF4_9STRA|nr:hypothetical protein JKP88DRAFT_300763 [Tribonema minus]